jgi:UDP-N-acetyl-D-galactosamine dehydrogenase
MELQLIMKNLFAEFVSKKHKICIIGLGYVGLSLAIFLNKKFDVVGYDIDSHKLDNLSKKIEPTNEIDKKDLHENTIFFTNNPENIKDCKLIIITVPTPIDIYNTPDLSPIINATNMVAKNMAKDSVIVYESTVYPGLTEEICIPILEKLSGFVWKKDFNVGYSPERVNPGDRIRTVDKVIKIVAGDTEETKRFLADIYGAVITAGIHEVSSIKVAEAAKVIENTQRDINIALINEFSLIFDKLDIDTKEVLDASGSKWNFLPFKPGLVGGHCIGVDPYYLTFKAESLGYHPQVILAGRRLNDSMGKYIAEKTVKLLIKADNIIKGAKVLILGFTFKEDVTDIRNTKVVDIYNELSTYGINAYVYDPCVDKQMVKHEYGIDILDNIEDSAPYDAFVLAVNHKIFKDTLNLKTYKKLANNKKYVLVDVKSVYDYKDVEEENLIYWRL